MLSTFCRKSGSCWRSISFSLHFTSVLRTTRKKTINFVYTYFCLFNIRLFFVVDDWDFGCVQPPLTPPTLWKKSEFRYIFFSVQWHRKSSVIPSLSNKPLPPSSIGLNSPFFRAKNYYAPISFYPPPPRPPTPTLFLKWSVDCIN